MQGHNALSIYNRLTIAQGIARAGAGSQRVVEARQPSKAIMSPMDTTIAMQSFIATAEKDNVLFGVVQSTRTQVRSWLWLLAAIFLYPLFIFFGQLAPFIFRKHLDAIAPHLPAVTDRATLAWLKDAFTLYHMALKDYRSVCLFRGRLDALLDDLDEEIDSLELVLGQEKFLQQTVAEITNR